MHASLTYLSGLAKAASSVSVLWQHGMHHGKLLWNVVPRKSGVHFHSTSAMCACLHRSLSSTKPILHCSPRTEAQPLFRTSHVMLKPLSHFRLGCCLTHTSRPSKFLRITTRLSRSNDGHHLYRNCSAANSNLFVPGSLRFKSSQRSSQNNAWRERNKSVMLYVIAGAVLVVGFSYAAVPLYTVFCQATGLGGQATAGHDTEKVETMSPVQGREIVVRFNADTAASMRWNFRPQQSEVKVVPGETALAFYSAMNPTDKPIVGISTYNVVPFDAGQYFNKIQCFCFEEQRLNPHEQVDMPVFFYIDPDFDDDPKMEKVNNITLSYTFFESKEGLELPDPWSRPE